MIENKKLNPMFVTLCGVLCFLFACSFSYANSKPLELFGRPSPITVSLPGLPVLDLGDEGDPEEEALLQALSIMAEVRQGFRDGRYASAIEQSNALERILARVRDNETHYRFLNVARDVFRYIADEVVINPGVFPRLLHFVERNYHTSNAESQELMGRVLSLFHPDRISSVDAGADASIIALIDEQVEAINLNADDLVEGHYTDAVEQEDALDRIFYLTMYAPVPWDMAITEAAAEAFERVFQEVTLDEDALGYFMDELEDVYMDELEDVYPAEVQGGDAQRFIEAVLLLMCEEDTGITFSGIRQRAYGLLDAWGAIPPGLRTAD